MTRLLFTAPYTWDGGYYELSFEFGAISDIEFRSALIALWAFPALEGCYLKRDLEPEEQDRVSPEALDLASNFDLAGVARLANGYSVACGSFTMRPDDETYWLGFYLPLGSLGEAYEIGAYPFDVPERSPDAWQKPLDDWLAQIGRFVFSRVPFKLGLIGMEAGWEVPAKELSRAGVPDKRKIGYLWPVNGELQYFARSG